MKKFIKVLIIILCTLLVLLIINSIRNYNIFKELDESALKHFNSTTYQINTTTIMDGKETSTTNKLGSDNKYLRIYSLVNLEGKEIRYLYKYYDVDKGVVTHYRTYAGTKDKREDFAKDSDKYLYSFGLSTDSFSMPKADKWYKYPLIICTKAVTGDNKDAYKMQYIVPFIIQDYELYDKENGVRVEEMNGTYKTVTTYNFEDPSTKIESIIEQFENDSEFIDLNKRMLR